MYKIASFEMTDLNLVKKVSQTKKPLSFRQEWQNYKKLKLLLKQQENMVLKICLFYCVSNYPSSIDDFNL